MHKVIHGMALWIASDYGKKKDKFLVKAGVQLTQVPKIVNWEEVEKVSLMDNCINTLDDAIPICPNLSTMLLLKNVLYFIRDNFFYSTPFLKVLDLSYSKMEELPISLTDLINLQHLNLSHTNVSQLPKSIQNLVNLEVLDLSCTEIEVLPPGVIGQLSSLQTFNMFGYSHANWMKEDDNLLSETKSFLEELERSPSLYFLGLTIACEPAIKKLQSSQKLQRKTRSLSVAHCKGLTSLPLASFEFMMNLIILEFRKCHDLKEIKVGSIVGEEISDRWIKRLQMQFHKLQHITVKDCWLLEELNWLSIGANLDSLEIDRCMNLTEIIITGRVDRSWGPFSNLKRLYLGYLPKLTCISRTKFDLFCLEEITVDFCPNLKRLPIDSNRRVPNLKMIKGHRNWWNMLQWEDRETADALRSRFVEIEL